MSMNAKHLRSVERTVLAWITRESKPVTTTELLLKHREGRISGEALRRAVWGLIDAGAVRFTSDRKLVREA